MKYAIRSQIQAPNGKVFVAADLSQAEAWIVAYLANEPTMKHELQFGQIHVKTARLIFENETITKDNKTEYYLGKRMNHSCNYRTSPFMIAIMINKDSDKAPYVTVTIKQTTGYHKKWMENYQVHVWWKEIEEKLNIDRTLVTPYRRERTFFKKWGNDLFKEATAYVPQSTVADHMLGAVQPEIGIEGGIMGIKRVLLNKNLDIKMINTSYDSCLLEVPLGLEKEVGGVLKEQLLRPLMINGETFTIPVDLEVGDRYGELEKLAA